MAKTILAMITLSAVQSCAQTFITGRNEVLAKVIFSQACVKNSVHGGGGVWSGPGGCLKFLGGGVSEIYVILHKIL